MPDDRRDAESEIRWNELDRIVAAALADFAACADPAALENSKARYLGKAGALTDQLKALGKLDAAQRPAAGARINEAKATLEAALARAREALADIATRGATRRRCARRFAARARHGRRHTAPRHAHARAHRSAVPLARLRGRRRSRDRGRLPQFHGAQHAGEPSGALDARHVLRRGRLRAAHAHVERAGAVHGNARAADQDHRAGPRLPRRQRRDALADVPSGRGAVDRRGRLVRRSQGRVHRVPAQLLRARRSQGALPPVVLSRSPNPRPRST